MILAAAAAFLSATVASAAMAATPGSGRKKKGWSWVVIRPVLLNWCAVNQVQGGAIDEDLLKRFRASQPASFPVNLDPEGRAWGNLQ